MQTIRAREDYLDYLKAFAGILVVIGHAFRYLGDIQGEISFPNRLAQLLIYSVHVPLYFVIAGFLCRKKPVLPFYQAKFQRIIIPYFTFCILKLIYSAFISNEFAHASNLVNVLFDAFFIGRLYWFAYCIFLTFLLAPLFWDETHEKRIFIALGCLCILDALVIFYPLPEEITVANERISNPFYQISNLLNFFHFFLIGLLVRNHKSALSSPLQRKRFLLSLAFVAVAFLSFLIMRGTIKQTVFTKTCLAFCLMYPLFLIAKALPKRLTILSQLGQYSLQIMFFDSFYKTLLFKIAARFVELNMITALFICALNIALTYVACTVIRKIPYVRILFGL
ncbi:MAG: acyltransferase [Oscillibacter sp.]|nr:acyltransferase [Oscillibacter sp.]